MMLMRLHMILMLMIFDDDYMLTPTGYPPPQHSGRRGPQRTQHTTSTAATPRYPPG